eukprot:scaffold5215_cov181-Amphora_coffeaeformis.AAC.21
MDDTPSCIRPEEERGTTNTTNAMGVGSGAQVESTSDAAASHSRGSLAAGGSGDPPKGIGLSIPPPSAFNIMNEQEEEDPDDEDLFGSGPEDNVAHKQEATPEQETATADVKSPNSKKKEESTVDKDLFDDEPPKQKATSKQETATVNVKPPDGKKKEESSDEPPKQETTTADVKSPNSKKKEESTVDKDLFDDEPPKQKATSKQETATVSVKSPDGKKKEESSDDKDLFGSGPEDDEPATMPRLPSTAARKEAVVANRVNPNNNNNKRRKLLATKTTQKIARMASSPEQQAAKMPRSKPAAHESPQLKGGTNTISYEGPPTKPSPVSGGWPPGWIERRYKRIAGDTKDREDSYFYPPTEKEYKLRSIKEVQRFLCAYNETKDAAYAFKQRKNGPTK